MLRIFQNQIHILFVLKAMVQFADMWMIELLLDLDLPLQDILSLVLINLFLRNDFQSIIFPRGLLPDQTDRPIGAFP